MNDITALAQREKFEAWFADDVVGAEVTFPAFEDGEYVEGDVYDPQLYLMLQSMWMAWQAARVELVETLESRTVTVKLPKAISVLHRRDFIDAHRAIYAYPEAELNAALAAAGIQVIEGEG